MNFDAIGLRIRGCSAAESQVDFSKGHTFFGTEAQRALLKRYTTPRKTSGKKGVHRKAVFSILNLLCSEI